MEIFREVIGFESDYLISNYGNVYSIKMNKLLSKAIDGVGYHFVKLGGRHGKNCSIHRLVAEAFLQNPDNKKTVNHIDGNKLNNMFYNLEWATYSENEQHAWNIGLKKTSDNRLKKVSKPVIQFSLNGDVISRFPSARDAARKLNIDSSGISKCCRGVQSTCYGYKWIYD